ncbi:hypothetical protein [Acidianus sp. RZ1]|uniref:hypothetical protein n=1 Tax=Acidianus sp. RZ1 TaxID=1540082 RepID=UPI001492448C|nr:hypothetical protein [Acidianus sp. RZ1]NON61967.1 hypothetical protein [Acidianus sp. RZ1]
MADEELSSTIILTSTSELESEIKKIEEEIKTHEQFDIDSQKKVLEELERVKKSISWLKIAESQGIWKSKTCRHGISGSCDAWNVSDPIKLGIPEDAVNTNQDGSKRVSINKFYSICITCPLYEANRINQT